MHCGCADGRSGPAVLAACAAQRWLARSAAGIRRIHNQTEVATAASCTSLVSCLPALEDVHLIRFAQMDQEDLGCLLEALACCPRLSALSLNMCFSGAVEGYTALSWPFPAPALAKLGSLASLELDFDADPHTLADVVGALVALTGLVELSIGFPKYADMHLVPAALGQLKALQSLTFSWIRPCVLEAGCLGLTNLRSLRLCSCRVADAENLPGVSALQCLTGIEFSLCTEALTRVFPMHGSANR